MRFIDRKNELSRLYRGLATEDSWVCVLWGRRRVGKSRLLLECFGDTTGVYFVADESASALQRAYFASAVAVQFPGFDEVSYPDWRSLLDRVAREAGVRGWTGPVIIDEFPYLAVSDPSVASAVQNWLDNSAKAARLKVILCGSSQRMMQGLVLDANAPLYGRANELFRLRPLPPGCIGDGFGLVDGVRMVNAYGAWGGTPRYWELAAPFGSETDDAIDALVLDPLGPLHHEPGRLLLEETPSAATLRPILDVIGAGAHRISEIAGRLGQAATSLARPITRLQELGLVRRETPFGSNERSSKRALYVIDDPFVRLWSRVVAPNRSLLAAAPKASRLAIWRKYRAALVAQAWEELCRRSIPGLQGLRLLLKDTEWMPARRYWRGSSPELDVVASSIDDRCLLIGEVKWSDKPVTPTELSRVYRSLTTKGIPQEIDTRDKTVLHALFVPETTKARDPADKYLVFTADDVMAALRE